MQQHRNFGAPARRGPSQLMPSNPQAPTQAQILQQQQAEHQAQVRRQEEAKNRSRKPVNKHLPEGLEQIVIGDGVQQYKSMRDVERRLDAVMMRRRLDIQDSLQRGPKQYGTMRIWISNTVENQPWQAGGMDPHSFDFSSNIEATFKVKIEGRLLDPHTGEPEAEDEDEDDAGQKPQEDAKEKQDGAGAAEDSEERAAKRTKLSIPPTNTPPLRKKFSQFFKSITIDFDRPHAVQPDGYTQIRWTRPDYVPSTQAPPPLEADFDCLEFERKADENINVVVNLVRDEHPAEKYKLSQPLAELLDMEEADRPTVLMALWEYIKLANLQMDDEQRRVSCDTKLREIFNTDSLLFHQLPELIRPYLLDLPPLHLPYTIRTDAAFHSSSTPPTPTIYDIRVPLPSPLTTTMRALIASPTHTTTLTTISRIDDRLALLLQAITHEKAKHGFLSSMCTDPVGFVRRWVMSQQRDLEVVLGKGSWGEADGEWGGEEWRRGGKMGVWGSEGAWEGVGSLLGKMK